MPERLIARRHGTKPASSSSSSSSSSVISIPYSLEQRSQLAIQKLYNACKQTFTGANGPLSDQALERIKFLLDKIKPSDVGLDESIAMMLPGTTGVTEMINGKQHQQVAPPISYLHIYECEAFSMGIFCLPVSAVIPLHNHPGMTVLSNLLYGSMHVKAYDWVDPMQLPSYTRLAKQVANCVMSAPCESSILYPTSGGNIHAFTAVTSCAVLDILAPPYSIEDGRHCTYYRDLPYSGDVAGGEDGAELAVLEEYKPPDEFSVRGAPYRGPELVL